MVVSNIKKKSLLADAEVYNHAAQHMLSVKKIKKIFFKGSKSGISACELISTLKKNKKTAPVGDE